MSEEREITAEEIRRRMRLDEIREFLVEGALVIDGLEDSIAGHTDQGLVVYDHEKMLEHFIGDGMTREDAAEWMKSTILNLQGNGACFVMLYRLNDE